MTRAQAMAGLHASALVVFAEIERAALAGVKCPDNGALSVLIGAQSTSAIPRIMGRLEERGLIQVERGAINRVVTIVDTGMATAGVVRHPHWSRGGVAQPQPAPKPLPPVAPARPRVHRDPCSRCGTRADFGCRHTRRPALFTNPQPQGLRYSEGAM